MDIDGLEISEEDSLEIGHEEAGRNEETKRLNLKKMNKPAIINGGTITDRFGTDGDTIIFKVGTDKKFAMKIEGEWWGTTLHKL